MVNPRLLLCDTDALIQLFLTIDFTRKLLPLRILKDAYGIQPAIVAEVEIELYKSRHYQDQFVPDLKKALAGGVLSLLDAAAFGNYVSPSNLAGGVFANYQSLARRHFRHVDRGEAYTLAAAVTLSEPALTNDASALETLDKQGFVLPSPVLRPFDLLSLCFQTGELKEKDCDLTRKNLIDLEEFVPKAFRNASFEDGIKKFCPRFLDDSKPAVGAAPTPCAGYKTQRMIARNK
jgi:hypothetical protein